MYPVNDRLPEELLAEILVFWASIDEDGAWMASVVCKYWRRIVLSCPKAWTNVSLIFKSDPPKEPKEWCIEEDDLERAASPRGRPRPLPLWFERSGDLLLSVHLYAEVTFPDLNLALGKRLGDLMLGFGRVRHLNIDIDSVHMIEAMCNLFSRHLPILQSLYLNNRCDRKRHRYGSHLPSSFDLTEFWPSFDRSRELRTIVLRGCAIPAPHTRSPLAELITTLDTDTVTLNPNGTLVMTSVCTNLTTLRLHPGQWFPSSRPTPPALRTPLHSLTSLSLGNLDAVDATHFLREFNTPNLLHLSLGGTGDSQFISRIQEGAKTYDLYSDMGNAFKAFVTRSPRIRELCLSKTFFPDRHLVEVLRQLDDLQELRCKKTYVGTPLFRALSKLVTPPEGPNKRLICPQLQRLKFVSCSLIQVDQLVSLLRARNSPEISQVPIRKLTLKLCDNIYEEEASKIKAANPEIMLWFKPPVIDDIDKMDDEEEEEEVIDDICPESSSSRVRFAQWVELDGSGA